VFDLLKFFVEVTLKILPSVSAEKRKNTLNSIGADLFQIYIFLNEAEMLGEIILETLDGDIERLGRKMATEGGEATITVGWQFPSLLTRQRQNLDFILMLLKKYGDELQVVDPVAYRKLRLSVTRKFNALSVITSLLGSSQIPIERNSNSLTELMDRLVRESVHGNLRDIKNFMSEVDNALIMVPVEDSWSASQYQELAEVLDITRLERQLASIRQSLDSLRESLTNTFSIQEILPLVGSRDLLEKMTRRV
jgi:hypothetical protein